MDVLLVQPRQLYPLGRIRSYEGTIPPLALMYLAKPLLDNGFDAGVLDLTVNLHIDGTGFIDYIRNHHPAVVGISCTTPLYNRALKTAALVKQADPDIKVIMGGSHVTFTATETLSHPCVDIVVRGEGDYALLQLTRYFIRRSGSLDDIDGISYKAEGIIKKNPGKFIRDIDALSFPSRRLVDLSQYRAKGTIYVGRGCPCKCRFCAAGAMAGGQYRLRSIQSILEEIDYLAGQLNLDALYFLDDTLTVCPETVKSICSHIKEKHDNVEWLCESRVDAINSQLVETMANSGCKMIHFGFESGSAKILASMKKNITPHQIESSVQLCLDHGIIPKGNFMIGFPDDTRETVNDTLAIAKKINRMGAQVLLGALTPLPGTYYYNHAQELGITFKTRDWDRFDIGNPIIDTRHFTCDQIREILFDNIAVM